MPHTTSKYTRKRQRRRPEAGEGPIEEGRTNGRTLLLFSTSHRHTLQTREYHTGWLVVLVLLPAAIIIVWPD